MEVSALPPTSHDEDFLRSVKVNCTTSVFLKKVVLTLYVHVRKLSYYIWRQRCPEVKGAKRIFYSILYFLCWVKLCPLPHLYVKVITPQDLRT